MISWDGEVSGDQDLFLALAFYHCLSAKIILPVRSQFYHLNRKGTGGPGKVSDGL